MIAASFRLLARIFSVIVAQIEFVQVQVILAVMIRSRALLFFLLIIHIKSFPYLSIFANLSGARSRSAGSGLISLMDKDK
jgi:hypothetical protein